MSDAREDVEAASLHRTQDHDAVGPTEVLAFASPLGRAASATGRALRVLPAPESPGTGASIGSSEGAILVVLGGEPRATARLAGRLVERGFTCSLVPAEALAPALASGNAAAAIVEVPGPEARGVSLGRWLAPLAAWDRPVVLLSSAPIRADLPELRLAGSFVRPFFIDDVLSALAAAGVEPVSAPPAAPPEDPVAGARVLLLDLVQVRGSLSRRDTGPVRIRLRSVGLDGTLSIEGRQLPGPGTALTVELAAAGAPRLALRARVTACAVNRIELSVEPGALDAAALETFAVASQDPAAPEPPQVAIRDGEGESASPVPDSASLAALWREAAAALDDEAAQQRFIQACVRAQSLEFAVQRYRELKLRDPEDARVARYLNQVGTILGFYALRKESTAALDGDRRIPRSVKLGLVFLGLLIAAFGVAAMLLGGRG